MPLSNDDRIKARDHSHRQRILHFANMARENPSLLQNERHANDKKNTVEFLGRHMKDQTREDIRVKAVEAADKRADVLKKHVLSAESLIASILEEYKITSVDQLSSDQTKIVLERFEKLGTDQQKELTDLDTLEIAHYETELLISLQKG